MEEKVFILGVMCSQEQKEDTEKVDVRKVSSESRNIIPSLGEAVWKKGLILQVTCMEPTSRLPCSASGGS